MKRGKLVIILIIIFMLGCISGGLLCENIYKNSANTILEISSEDLKSFSFLENILEKIDKEKVISEENYVATKVLEAEKEYAMALIKNIAVGDKLSVQNEEFIIAYLKEMLSYIPSEDKYSRTMVKEFIATHESLLEKMQQQYEDSVKCIDELNELTARVESLVD